MITFWADGELLAAIDSARKRPPRSDRSQFIRDAIVEKLRALGYEVAIELAEAPDRASKVTWMNDNHSGAMVAEQPARRYGGRRKKKQ